jgi:hypothetical protein
MKPTPWWERIAVVVLWAAIGLLLIAGYTILDEIATEAQRASTAVL